MKILTYILGGACVILIILLIFARVDISSKDAKIISLEKELYACQHAPVKWREVTRVDTFVVVQKVPVPYKIVEHDTIFTMSYETLAKRFSEKKYYKDSINFGNNKLGGRVSWNAFVTMNNLIDLKLNPVIFHHVDSIGIKVVDTCFSKPPAYKPKNHLILSVMMSGVNTKQFPNTSAMIRWDIKDRVGLGVGGEYNTYHNELYLKAGIDFYLK